MDLFSHAHVSAGQQNDQQTPLAELLRPKDFSQMLGQSRIIGDHTPWKKIFESGEIPSLVLWGPPGTGKTTLASLLSQTISADFVSENAIDLGAKALREIGEAARRRRFEYNKKTVVFIDEIHRLNKGQQDVLLPFLERGDLILIGATTENPSYELNSALLSRLRILVFERHTKFDLLKLAERALGHYKIELKDMLSDEAVDRLLEIADGDARRLINMIELTVKMYSQSLAAAANESTHGGSSMPSTGFPLAQQNLEEILNAPLLRYDRSSDEHYDTVSAFIKSIRGSDPDAAVYYLSRMIKGGEDPMFIARRLIILASEDIGNADPRALSLAVSVAQAVEYVGLPEGAIPLAQVATYLASAPKSNRAYLALRKAQNEIETTGTLPIPLSLRSGESPTLKNLGYGKDYQYSHDSERGYIKQEFLPQGLRQTDFYIPTDHGFEKNIRLYLEWLKK